MEVFEMSYFLSFLFFYLETCWFDSVQQHKISVSLSHSPFSPTARLSPQLSVILFLSPLSLPPFLLLLSVYLPAQNTSLSRHKDSTESLNRHLLPLCVCVCVSGEEIKTSHPPLSSLLSVSVRGGVFLVTLAYFEHRKHRLVCQWIYLERCS